MTGLEALELVYELERIKFEAASKRAWAFARSASKRRLKLRMQLACGAASCSNAFTTFWAIPFVGPAPAAA